MADGNTVCRLLYKGHSPEPQKPVDKVAHQVRKVADYSLQNEHLSSNFLYNVWTESYLFWEKNIFRKNITICESTTGESVLYAVAVLYNNVTIYKQKNWLNPVW